MHLVLATILLMEAETVQVTRQVIGGAGIYIPVGVDGVRASWAGVGDVAGALTLLFWLEGVVEPVAAVEGVVAELGSDLTL